MCYTVFVFFKQMTAYEMRLSDWSSDVCSSDLNPEQGHHRQTRPESAQRYGALRLHRMTYLPSPTEVRFDEDSFWVDLEDGRTLGIPLAWFPRLLHATPAQREAVSLSRAGLHWEEIDEDISIAGLIAGRGDQTRNRKEAA